MHCLYPYSGSTSPILFKIQNINNSGNTRSAHFLHILGDPEDSWKRNLSRTCSKSQCMGWQQRIIPPCYRCHQHGSYNWTRKKCITLALMYLLLKHRLIQLTCHNYYIRQCTAPLQSASKHTLIALDCITRRESRYIKTLYSGFYTRSGYMKYKDT